VVEALAAFGKPVGVHARPLERLDQLVLRAAGVQREPERPLGRGAAVLTALALRAEDPGAPRSRGEPGVELADRALEVADDEGDLERGGTL
jgi:hypothetical protein